MPTRAIVVGAGIIGLSVAEELTRRGVEVELLERNPDVGQEASSAAAGILSPQGEAKGPGPFYDLLRAGHALFPETIARLEAITRLDVGYKASGELAIAISDEDEQELTQEYQWQQQAGLQVEKLSAGEVKKLEPNVDGPLRWGVWWPQTTQVDCVRLVRAYAELVKGLGVTVKTQTPAGRFLTEKDRVIGVETPSGTLKADWVIDCAGSWAGFDRSFALPIPTVPVKGQLLQLRTASPLFQRVVRSSRAYLVQRSPEQLIAGTTVEWGCSDKTVTEEGKSSILRGAREISSRLKEVSVETAWAGLRPGTPDQLPILGPTPLNGLLLATGHFRNGVLLAPLTGRLIAEWVTQGRSSIDLAPFQVSRFLAKAVSS